MGLPTCGFGVWLYTLCMVRRALTWKNQHKLSGTQAIEIWKSKNRTCLKGHILKSGYTGFRHVKFCWTWVHNQTHETHEELIQNEWESADKINSRLTSLSPLESAINLLEMYCGSNMFQITKYTKQIKKDEILLS